MVSILEDKVEGWVTGLRLAALFMHQKENQERVLKELRESAYFIQDYLIKEVLLHVPKPFADYLLETSILDRFCAPLCDAIHADGREQKKTDEPLTGQAFIDWLEETNLFVIPLDEKRQWFRYHHLFQELLQDQLKQTMDPDVIAALHKRASEWFENRALIDEAVKHSMAAEDTEQAAQIVERHRQETINNDQWYILEKWLSYLPEKVIHQRVELLLARSWILMHHFRFDVVLPLLDHIESLLSDEPTHEPLRGEIALCRGYSLFFMGEGALSLELMTEALDKIPVSFYEARAQTEVIFSLASLTVGRKEQAVRGLDDLVAHYDSPQELRKTRLLVTYVFIHYLSCDLQKAELANRRLEEVAWRCDYAYAKAWTQHLQGLIHLQRCEWEAAIEHLEQSVVARFIHFKRTAADSITGLMLAYQALGRKGEAQAKLQVFEDFVTSMDDPAIAFLMGSAKARLAIMQGRLEPAMRWLETVELPPEGAMIWWLDVPSVTYCRALIAEGSPASLDEAEKQLSACEKMNETHHNSCQLIGIWALQAIARAKQGKAEEAASILERALSQAGPGGFIFPFVELGSPMVEMLKHLRKQKVAEDFIGQILAAYKSEEQQAALSPDDSSNLWIEDLTQRERDVLTYLAEGLSNKEIGAKLFLSPLTVKKHLYNIYQKLDVHSRTGAINKARELGLLSLD
jgi:LuxR family maltose regulon positive regulatory protein